MRQGCLLNPLLFSVLIVNLEKEMGRVKWGEVKLKKGKVYTLSYADDLVLIAKKDEMRSIIDRLERYVERNRLELNAKKSKVTKFKKEGWAK